MLRNANPLKRIKLIKMIHHWQNMGIQKGMIRDSRLRLASNQPKHPIEEIVDCHLFPEGCGQVEGKLHYLHCQIDTLITSRDRLIKKALKKMSSLWTSGPTMSLMGNILKSISTKEILDYKLDKLKLDVDSSLAKAPLEGQKRIGWMAMCQGFLHKAWAETQHTHYKILGVKTRYLNIG